MVLQEVPSITDEAGNTAIRLMDRIRIQKNVITILKKSIFSIKFKDNNIVIAPWW